MFETKLDKLKLGESIGYTFKCLGAGFWAFKQKNFRTAIQQVTMEVRLPRQVCKTSTFGVTKSKLNMSMRQKNSKNENKNSKVSSLRTT